MPRRTEQTIPVTPGEALAHKEQAEEYLRAAHHSLSHGDFNAAAGTAVDAGINAADAVAGMNMGQRWKGAHEQAADFAAKAGSEGKEVARELRRLLPLKTQAHYEPATVSETKRGVPWRLRSARWQSPGERSHASSETAKGVAERGGCASPGWPHQPPVLGWISPLQPPWFWWLPDWQARLSMCRE